MSEIYLARAGATEFDDEQRIVGTLDIPVSVKGRAEIDQLAHDLAEKDIGRIYTSNDTSAKESAKLLGDLLGAKVRVLDDLHNIDFGLWQGLPVSEVRRKHPRLYKQWEECPLGICPPAGETVESVVERLQKPLGKVVKRSRSEPVVLMLPNPLYKIVRCFIKKGELERVWENGNPKLWEALSV